MGAKRTDNSGVSSVLEAVFAEATAAAGDPGGAAASKGSPDQVRAGRSADPLDSGPPLLFDNLGLMTVEELAMALGKSPKTIKNWVANRIFRLCHCDQSNFVERRLRHGSNGKRGSHDRKESHS